MDPVMQTLFGKLPIEKIPSVHQVKENSRNTVVIYLIGGVAIFLGITAYVLYKQNMELRQKTLGMKSLND